MGDFERVMALRGQGGDYSAAIDGNWCVWSPAGGYLMALALRAAGLDASFRTPVSMTCHFLAAPRLDDAQLRVSSLRKTRVAESLRVSMMQRDRPIVECLVWAGEALDGYRHADARMPEVPRHEDLVSSKTGPGKPGFQTLWQHLEHRGIGPMHWQRDEPAEPRQRDWVRLRDFDSSSDAFADAGRQALILDSYTWPAAAHAHAGDARFVAPTISLSIDFHQRSESPWLLSDAYAPIAEDGRIGIHNRLWSPDGRLLSTAHGTLLCRPRPSASSPSPSSSSG